jgi:hypothetical protein
VPGIYFHSLFGSRGWPEGVAQTGRNRTINREKLDADTLARELANPQHRRHAVFNRLAQLLRARAASPAFDPLGQQRVLDVGPAVFAVLRQAGGHWAVCLHNVAATPQPVTLALADWGVPERPEPIDLIDGRPLLGHNTGTLRLTLAPFQVLWLGGPAV